MKLGAVLLLVLAGASVRVQAQTSPSWDSSGNNQLSGNYYFREVAYVVGDFSGNLSTAVSLYGAISFDGNGQYTLNGSIFDSGSSPLLPRTYSSQGTYTIASSGMGFLSSPISNGARIYGLVSDGVFAGSSTESGFQDLFVASRGADSPATEASMQGSYWIANMNFPSGSAALARSAFFELNADGQGGFATPVDISGFITGAGTTAISQAVGSLSYRFGNGTGTLSFPAGTLNNSTLIAGDNVLYISRDGNLVFGGSATGWDFFRGVRAGPALSDSSFTGLYYQAGLDHDGFNIAAGFAILDSYYGAFQAQGGRVVGHKRVNSPFAHKAVDYTYGDSYIVNEDGKYEDANQANRYGIGAGGALRVGFGEAPFLGIQLAIKAPEFSGSGVFLNPAGVVNAASSAPFTTSLSRGQLITLYGSNLAPNLEIAATTPFPTSLAGVQVMINDRAAPLYYASSNQISAIVPAATELSVARIQVVNNGETSNAITAFMGFTTPGVFTVPPGGLGQAAALHADFSLVTTSNPAQVGEVIAVYVSGLGTAFPPVADGAPGPSDVFSIVTNRIGVRIDGQPAAIPYAGLAPGLAGLYQINVQIPSNIHSGDVSLAVTGPDSFAAQAVVPIAAGTGTISGAPPRQSSKISRPAGCAGCKLPQALFRWNE